MDGVDIDPEERLSLSSDIDAAAGFSSLEIEHNPILEVNEDRQQTQHEEEEEEEEKEEEEEEEKEKEEEHSMKMWITPQKLVNLQRDLATSAASSITSADAKELKQRTELEKARKIRLEQLENDVNFTHAKCEELLKGWQIKNKNQKMIPQELEKVLKSQQQLCAVVLDGKKQLINDLHQELKRRNELHDKTLKKNAEEIDLLMERHEHQIKVLTNAYSQELKDTERVYLKEFEMLHADDKMKLEEELKAFSDKEETMTTLMKTTMEKCQAKIQEEGRKTRVESLMELKQLSEWQSVERETQKIGSKLVAKEKIIGDIERETRIETKLRKHYLSLKSEIKDLKAKLTEEENDFKKKSQPFLDDYQRSLRRYERLQNQVKHFAHADARQYEEVWQTIDREVKHLVKNALEIDSVICSRHLGLAWNPPPMAFMEICGPIRPQTKVPANQLFQTESALKGSQGVMGASTGLSLETVESVYLETDKEGKAVQAEGGPEVEEEHKTLQTVVELLCDEAGFLITDSLLKVLTPLEKEEQSGVKLASLLCSLGIEDKDVPKLTLFLLKYERQQREQTEDVCGCDTEEEAAKMNTDNELMDRNNILLALKSFLEHERRSRGASIQERCSSRFLEAYDASAVDAYWESMGNIISEDKLKLWDATEVQLRKYQAVLTEASDLTAEAEMLEQQNTEMQKLLHQHHAQKSGVNMYD